MYNNMNPFVVTLHYTIIPKLMPVTVYHHTCILEDHICGSLPLNVIFDCSSYPPL